MIVEKIMTFQSSETSDDIGSPTARVTAGTSHSDARNPANPAERPMTTLSVSNWRTRRRGEAQNVLLVRPSHSLAKGHGMVENLSRLGHCRTDVAFPAGCDELIDHRLSDVDEVTVLRFPQHERVFRLRAVTVLEAKHRRLGQRAVVDLEVALHPREML